MARLAGLVICNRTKTGRCCIFVKGKGSRVRGTFLRVGGAGLKLVSSGVVLDSSTNAPGSNQIYMNV